jgi:hypothetical protein
VSEDYVISSSLWWCASARKNRHARRGGHKRRWGAPVLLAIPRWSSRLTTAQASNFDNGFISNPQQRALRQGRQINPPRCDVLAQVAWPHVNPVALSSSINSVCIRCSCRKFGRFGYFFLSLRCCTVDPQCASPSMPNPGKSVMLCRSRLPKV